MRQVPQYLIIGNGRVARHFQHYFALLNIPHLTWNRSQSHDLLQAYIHQSSHILLLIKDSAIDVFIREHLVYFQGICIHFSGSLISKHAYGAHPLLCFNEHLYELSQYLAMPFVVDEDAPEFVDLLPCLPNQHHRLKKSLKAKYHALCVLSGNFSCLLWQKLFSDMETELNIPQQFAHAYLKRQMDNLILDPANALTGPLVRNDQQTIEKNLSALGNDLFKPVYESFVNYYRQLSMEKSK